MVCSHTAAAVARWLSLFNSVIEGGESGRCRSAARVAALTPLRSGSPPAEHPASWPTGSSPEGSQAPGGRAGQWAMCRRLQLFPLDQLHPRGRSSLSASSTSDVCFLKNVNLGSQLCRISPANSLLGA